jgi:hypothetical protein
MDPISSHGINLTLELLCYTDMDATIKDDPLTSPSTKSRTRATEDRRSSNFGSTSCRVASSPLSRAAASSR